MVQYINKTALVAEIERRIKEHHSGYLVCLKDILSFLDTIEVKEVDLENELKEDWLFADKTEIDCLESMCLTEDMFISLAKKYFELGMRASNPITAAAVRGTEKEMLRKIIKSNK